MNEIPVQIPAEANPHSAIPEQLMSILVELRPLLQVQGIVQRKGGVYRLRYRQIGPEGYRQHKSLPLGTDERIIAEVRALIQTWRRSLMAQHDAEIAAEAAAEAVNRLKENEAKALRSLAQALAGGLAQAQTYWKVV